MKVFFKFCSYIGGEVNAPPAQKRVDVGVESFSNAGAGFEGSTHVGSDHAVGTGGQVTYNKEVAFGNPNFFRDIFNVSLSFLYLRKRSSYLLT